MSLEQEIKQLSYDINQLCELIKINNDLLKNMNFTEKQPGFKLNRMLTEPNAAKYIGMSRSFLSQDRMNGYRENRTKGPKATKIGRSIRYSIDELDSWLKENMK